jgi:hypothetical protein
MAMLRHSNWWCSLLCSAQPGHTKFLCVLLVHLCHKLHVWLEWLKKLQQHSKFILNEGGNETQMNTGKLTSLLQKVDDLPVGSILMTGNIWCGSNELGPWSLPVICWCCCCNSIGREEFHISYRYKLSYLFDPTSQKYHHRTSKEKKELFIQLPPFLLTSPGSGYIS